MKDYRDVSIVIPTLNEEKSVGYVIDRIRQHLPGAEIIVVDSSNDRTAQIAQSLRATVIKQRRMGYGAAIRTGLEKARGEILAFMDGDGTYDPEDLKKLVEIIRRGESDIVTGLRFKSKPASMSVARYVGNNIINTIFSVFFFRRLRDTQTGMKVFSRNAYLKMRLKENGMPFSTEVLTEACKRNLRILEERIRYYNRIGFSKLNLLKDGLRIILFILKESFTLRD
ncbi:MAG: glycosyltransferase family 2 protein [Thermoproteota archaeon]